MTTNQEGVHLAVRDITGTALSYNEDWHALFDAEGITAGTFNERMLGWINATLSASYTNVNEAMQAFAVEQGFANWASMNTFVAGSEAATFLRTYGPYGMVLDFADASIAIKEASGVLDFTSQGQVSGGALVGPGAKTTYSAPSVKNTEQADGFIKFQAHNLYLNSAAPANQSITVLSGASYAITITGSVSMVASGAATGTWTAGTTTFTAATGTLTLGSTSGSGTVHLRRTPSVDTYIATTSATAYDLPYVYSGGGVRQSIVPEPAATNLCLRSNDFANASWTKSNMTTALTATGPDGVANSASTLTATAANATALQAITSASSSRLTSVYIKRRTGSGNIDLTQDNGTTWTTQTVTSSWTRVALAAVTSTNPTVGIRIVSSGDAVDVWCFQHETGTVATSPIITYGAAVARAADNTSEALADFPFTAATGTWVVKYRTRSNALGCVFSLSASAGSDANLMVFYGQNGAGSCNLVSYDGSGVLQVNMTQAVNGADQWNTVAIAVEANNFAMSANGQPVVTDVSATVPAPTTLRIGSNRASNQHLNGDVQIIAYFTDRKSNAQLQELSAL